MHVHSVPAPCPRCGAQEAQPVGFTWWGGMLGPKLLSHVRCPRCRMEYNGKTGASNTTGIILYQVAGVVIAILLFVVVFGGSFLAALLRGPH